MLRTCPFKYVSNDAQKDYDIFSHVSVLISCANSLNFITYRFVVNSWHFLYSVIAAIIQTIITFLCFKILFTNPVSIKSLGKYF